MFEVDQPIVAFQLLTFEQHVVLSWLPQLEDVCALIPDLDGPGPILSLRDRPLEVKIAQWMIGHLDRQSFDARLCRWTLGDCPALQNPIKFKPEIPVESRGIVFLNHEAKPSCQGETVSCPMVAGT